MEMERSNTYGFQKVFGDLKTNIRSYTMVIALIIIWCILGVLTKGVFFLPRNLSMLVRQTAGTGIMTLGMLLIVITGGIDLSAGSAMGLLGGIAACCQVWYGMSVGATILTVVLCGVLIGAWHGFWIAYMKVPAFVATLGSQLALRGVLLGITKSVTIAPMSDAFKMIGQGYISTAASWLTALVFSAVAVGLIIKGRGAKARYGFEVPNWSVVGVECVMVTGLTLAFVFILLKYQGIPIPVLLMLALAAVIVFVMNKTRFGRSVYALGCNREASDLAGLNTRRVEFLVYVLEAVFCGIAGVILTARLNAGASSAGESAEMDAIAACVIGGASLSGGVGTVVGAVIGALVMTSLDNGMSLLNTENFWQYIIKGMILLAAVCVDILTKRKGR